ncbi:LPXTG cell wall anchor domain-containing protein [Bifidobacterium moukalabense]|uniref:LPXTG cell wall anchor domain-containing protein n=1 Tax=Bifidobacterium moukalabense TaxID=1333651 RepID=UPI001268D9E5|nr:LPXTG cell wall anchor domain-containing protein [Bifidobacterium moukalabense]
MTIPRNGRSRSLRISSQHTKSLVSITTTSPTKKSTAVELPSTGGTGDGWFIGGGLLTVMVASFGLAESLKNAKRSKVSQK